MKKQYRENHAMSEKMDALLKDIYAEFGWKTKTFAPLAGRFIYHALRKEEERLANDWSYKTSSFYEKNEAALALESTRSIQFKPTTSKIKCVTPEIIVSNAI